MALQNLEIIDWADAQSGELRLEKPPDGSSAVKAVGAVEQEVRRVLDNPEDGD